MRTFAFPPNKALKTNQYANSCASLLVGTAALLGLGSVMTGCKKAEETPAALVSVQAERVEQKNLTEYVVGDAVLAPLAQSALVPKISAPVKKFLVQRGAHVKQGQLLAVLENADLAASVTDSKGSLTQAQAAFDTSIKAQIPEDKQKAQLDVAQTKAQMELAKTTMDARKSLLDQGAIPRRDYETAAAIYVQAKAAYDIAEHHLNSLNSVSQQASIDSAKGALVSAKGKYAAAAAGLGYSEIRSPIDGVITDRPLFAGEMAQAGSPILTVMDTSSLIAKVHLSQAQVGIMKVGAPALLMIPGMDAPQNATVSLVSPALDAGSTTLEVWVKIANRNGALKAGTPVHVKIAKQTLHDVLTVPNEAVVASKTGEPAVMVIGSDGAVKSTPVKTGITDGTDTQIVTGIKQGDQVVTTGAYGMDDGTKVKVVAKGAANDDDAKPGTKPVAGDKD